MQAYSSSFQLDPELTEQQADILRLQTKIKDPYSYFQERQNRILHAYELMSAYKIVTNIEKEIKEAQSFLQQAEQFYKQPQGRWSPSRDEYNYIRRLIDDGEPVVLTKKMRKALQIKEEVQKLDKALREDLKDAGLKKAEIDALNKQEIEASDEDSVERRKRKALKEANKKAGITQKEEVPRRVTKKEKARLAYRAERERQAILRPKSKKVETVWEQQQRIVRNRTAPGRRRLQQQKPPEKTIQSLDQFGGLNQQIGETELP